MIPKKELKVYLSGEVHSNWRDEIISAAQKENLPLSFFSAVTEHDASDAAGDVLGEEDKSFWRDHKSAKINAIRTQLVIKYCDVAIIRFGQEFKQWNVAFDAGYCAALGKPYITLHSEEITHALKEVDAAAQAWAQTPAQVVEILKYISTQE